MKVEELTIKNMIPTEVVKGKFLENDAIVFKFDDGRVFALSHLQDCCEEVVIESIDGELNDLVGQPLLMAEVAYQKVDEDNCTDATWGDCYTSTWSFYKFATINGYVTIRFLGTSNGYYSETVDDFWVEESELECIEC